MFSIKKFQTGKWTNWAQTITAHPSEVKLPTSIEQVQQMVTSARNIRVTGAAHSFSAVAKPEQTALSLHYLRGLIEVDEVRQEALFYAGTYLKEVGPALAAHGFALSNMGDIQEQTLAGAIATGTHGTGLTLGSFADMVVEWTFVDGLGQVHIHRRGKDELSQALHVSLGLLGILVKVRLKVVPLYHLHYISTREPLSQVRQQLTDDIHYNRHIEWFYFPGCDMVQVKRSNIAPPQAMGKWQRDKEKMKVLLVENMGFYALSEICRIRPSLSQRVSAFSAANVTTTEKYGLSYEIFPTPRLVKFTEVEYAIPLHDLDTCLQVIHQNLQKSPFAVHFPLECRVSAGESGYLSPTQGEACAYIAFHMYKGMDDSAYFSWVHHLMQSFGGRPHWGKSHHLTATLVQQMYPDVFKFLRIREQYDPNNVFLTTYLKQLFYKI